MRRNRSRHSDGNSVGSVYKEVRIAAGKNHRLFFLAVEVRNKIDCIFVDISEHLQGERTHPRLCITLRGRTVAVDGTKVSMSVNQRITHGEILSHTHHGVVDGTVSVGMIFTHDFTDDSGRFFIGFIRRDSKLRHSIENSSVHRLHTIPHIRKRSPDNDTHGVVDVGILHLVMDFVLYDVFIFQ